MTQNTKQALLLCIVAAMMFGAMGWLITAANESGFWWFRIGAPIVLVWATGCLLWAKGRRKRAPDFLSKLSGATILLLVLTLCGAGCDRPGAPAAGSTTTTTVVPSGMKICFNCGGVGNPACVAPGCKNGMVVCPGPCLKLGKGTWEHMHVDGHSDTDVWQKFPQSDGTSQAWNQAHVGQVIEMQGGKAVNIGACKICGGRGQVKCAACGGTGLAVCPICDGQKVVPESWTAYNNPKLKNPPKALRLKDGRTIFGKIESQMGSTVYVRTESGKQEEFRVGDIISSTTNR